MQSREFIESVEDLIAHSLSIDASVEIAQAITGKPGRNAQVEDIVYHLLRVAMSGARNQLATPRSGTMDFKQAMEKVRGGTMVTRPAWPILHALQDGEVERDDKVASFYPYPGHMVWYYRLDNLCGAPGGGGTPYSPRDDDLAATDWMEYQPPIRWYDVHHKESQ